MNFEPKEMRLNKFEYTVIPRGRDLYRKVSGLSAVNRQNGDQVADFTSREYELISDSMRDVNNMLKDSQMPSDFDINPDTGAEEPEV